MKVSKGLLLGAGWLLAKEMCDGGWKSWVPTLRTNPGRERREFMTGAIERPSSTAREPVWSGLSWGRYWEDEVLTNGWAEVLLHIDYDQSGFERRVVRC